MEEKLKRRAMNSDGVMIGEFGDGSRNHSVLIDGRNNIITDPVVGVVERTDAGLQQLGIKDFHSLRTITRAGEELGDKKRRQLQKKTNLPWIHDDAGEDDLF